MAIIFVYICKISINMVNILVQSNVKKYINIYIQTRFQKSWDTVQIVNKKGMHNLQIS